MQPVRYNDVYEFLTGVHPNSDTPNPRFDHQFHGHPVTFVVDTQEKKDSVVGVVTGMLKHYQELGSHKGEYFFLPVKAVEETCKTSNQKLIHDALQNVVDAIYSL